jgi:dTDP-4-dehydrorhamnose 3,5-epimerase
MTVFQDITESRVPGCFLIRPWIRKDARGSFIKTFHAATFQSLGLETDFREDYYSISQKGVLRGMHFQRPPHQHAKLVYCAQGGILDAVVDLRSGTPGFGAHEVFNLSSENGCIVYVPAGVAHGFFVQSEEAITVYKVTTEYNPEADDGVRWDSCGIQWPSETPLLSPRDNSFRPLGEATGIFSGSLHE